MSSILFSDVHLRDPDSPKTQRVILFLEQIASRHDQIFILGDLFDVWPGTTEFLIERFGNVLRTLRKLVVEGKTIHYIEGNHDFRLGEYFSNDLGIQIHSDRFETMFGSKRVLLEHGDLGNSRDRAYRTLRTILRSPILHFALKAVPSKFIFDLGVRSSTLSRDVQKKAPPPIDRIRQIFREAAEDRFRQGFDVVIMGHTHIPDHHVAEIDGRTCEYFNTGDWVSNFTYLEYVDARFYTKTHSVTP